MRFEVLVEGKPVSVELARGPAGWLCTMDGQLRPVDVVEVAPGLLSVLFDGRSFTVYLERRSGVWRVRTRGADLVATVNDPRRWAGGSRSGGLGLAGRQEVRAPMPGKVVRVLVQEKQEVEGGQGVAVVEAMKMQNEIPSPKSGVVEHVRVREGDTVEHGTVLVVIA